MICSDVIKSLPNLSNINILSFTSESSIHTAKPSAILAHYLLSKLPKVNTLRLSYNYLFNLLKSPLIVQILTKQIVSLCIQIYNNLPGIDDIHTILNIFSSNLHFEIYFDFSPDDLYLILPFLFSEKWKKFYTFHFRLLHRQQQISLKFSHLFKQRLKDYLNAESEKRKTIYKMMEFRITDKEFSISF